MSFKGDSAENPRFVIRRLEGKIRTRRVLLLLLLLLPQCFSLKEIWCISVSGNTETL